MERDIKLGKERIGVWQATKGSEAEIKTLFHCGWCALITWVLSTPKSNSCLVSSVRVAGPAVLEVKPRHSWEFWGASKPAKGDNLPTTSRVNLWVSSQVDVSETPSTKRLPDCFLARYSNHFSWLISMRKSSGSTLSSASYLWPWISTGCVFIPKQQQSSICIQLIKFSIDSVSTAKKIGQICKFF